MGFVLLMAFAADTVSFGTISAVGTDVQMSFQPLLKILETINVVHYGIPAQMHYKPPLVVVLILPAAVIGFVVVWQLDRLLAAYRQGAVLTVRNAVRVRRVGQLLLGLFVVEPISWWGHFFVWKWFFSHPADALMEIPGIVFSSVDITLDLLDLRYFLAGFIALIVGHVMWAASMVAEEADLTV